MAEYYVDLGLGTDDHAGTVNDPWSFNDWQANVGALETSTFYMKGSYTYTSSGNFYWGGLANDHTYLPWNVSLNGPWRIYCSNSGGKLGLNYANLNVTGLIGKSNNTSDESVYGNLYSCYLLGPNATLNIGDGAKKGCTFIFDSAGYGGYTMDDCVFILNSIGHGGNTYNNCTFSLDPGGGNTYNDCEISWDNPTMPDWDGNTNDFKASTLYGTISTPPQPGNPPYTGYATDLWGYPRTGVGAGYMYVAPVPNPGYPADINPDLFIGMPPKSGSTGGNLQHSDTKFGNPYGDVNSNAAGHNGADGTENGGPVRGSRSAGGILTSSSLPPSIHLLR